MSGKKLEILVFRRVDFLLQILIAQALLHRKFPEAPHRWRWWWNKALSLPRKLGSQTSRSSRQGPIHFPYGFLHLPSLKLTYSLKIDPWKRRFLLETTNFRGELLVFGGVVSEKLEISHYGLL